MLVADDHPLIGWALTKVLEPLGFEVSVAQTRAEARGLLLTRRFECVVMSARIGDADMLDVIEEISRYQTFTRLFVLTEPGSTEVVTQAVPSARCFEKPFGVGALAEMVRANVQDDQGHLDLPA